MRRIIYILLCLLVLLSAVDLEAKRTRRSKPKARTRTTKVVSKPRVDPEVQRRNDSIAEALRQQQIRDSINAVMSRAHDGNISAINELASWYYNGTHVPQDYREAIKWWKKAADLSDARALAALGECHRYGHGTTPDSITAADYYQRSIRAGNGALFKQNLDSSSVDPFAAMVVADCYYRGSGISRDPAKAADLYAKAVAAGSAAAVPLAASVYMECGDTVNALRYLPTGADTGDPQCLFYYGILMSEGKVPGDMSHAISILEKAAGYYGDANLALGEIYEQGRGVPVDLNRALMYYENASATNSPQGYFDMARISSALPDKHYDIILIWLATAYNDGLRQDVTTWLTDLVSNGTGAFADYVRGLRQLFVEDNIKDANRMFKRVAKSGAPEGNLMQGVAAAWATQPKPNAAKAIKILDKYQTELPMAQQWLDAISTTGVASASVVDPTLLSILSSLPSVILQ